MTRTGNSFPRVLLIGPSGFNNVTGGGVTFSNLFRGWARDAIATVTNDPVPVSEDVCSRYYHLTAAEITYMRPFSLIASPSSGRSGAGRGGGATGPGLGYQLAKSVLGDAGVPDRGLLSPALANWIRSFRPEMVYSILGSPGIVDLVDQIHRRFEIPIAVHLMDDGVTDPRRSGLFGRYLRRLYRRKFLAILKKASLRMAICDAMARAYEERYGCSFDAYQNTIDLAQWRESAGSDLTPGDPVRIAYVGSVLVSGQLHSLLHCCEAVRALHEKERKIRLDIHTPCFREPALACAVCREPPVYLHDTIRTDDEFRRTLCEADVLLLPVNFDRKSIDFIRLSMPTKVPAYLASGTPILVYGPRNVAQVEYALEAGWGHVVSERSMDDLVAGLKRIIDDADLRQRLSGAALKAAPRHEIGRVRGGFQQALREAARR